LLSEKFNCCGHCGIYNLGPGACLHGPTHVQAWGPHNTEIFNRYSLTDHASIRCILHSPFECTLHNEANTVWNNHSLTQILECDGNPPRRQVQEDYHDLADTWRSYLRLAGLISQPADLGRLWPARTWLLTIQFGSASIGAMAISGHTGTPTTYQWWVWPHEG
jgi:hypothetical protein